jgi:hypothetical protein
MATAAPVYEDRQMSIGRVFQRAFSAISLNPVVILGLALVVGALPSLIVTYLLVQAGATSANPLQPGFSMNRLMGAAFVSGVISMVIAALVQGALTRATVTASEGRRATFGESLSAGLRVVLPLIGLSLLWALAVGIGFILLVVPGVILLLMWAVAVPALVVERDGVMTAFARSAELTKGARWKIFGLFLVMLVAYWLLSLVIGLVGLRTYGLGATTTGLTIGNLVGSIILGTIFNTLWGTIQPSLYVELRQWKGGDSLENLEQVFA